MKIYYDSRDRLDNRYCVANVKNSNNFGKMSSHIFLYPFAFHHFYIFFYDEFSLFNLLIIKNVLIINLQKYFHAN